MGTSLYLGIFDLMLPVEQSNPTSTFSGVFLFLRICGLVTIWLTAFLIVFVVSSAELIFLIVSIFLDEGIIGNVFSELFYA